MNREEILQMTPKEIEIFLNENVKDLVIESEHDSIIKGKMIEKVNKLFTDNSINTTIPYYTNTEFIIKINNINITFKVGCKKTGETVTVSRLKKKDIKTVGKFKFDNIFIEFNEPNFDEDYIDNYKVKLDKNTTTSNINILLNNKNEKLIDLFKKDRLFDEINKQNTDSITLKNGLRNYIILLASQPIIKKRYFEPGFNQDSWDNILEKVEEFNKELIDEEINKILTLY